MELHYKSLLLVLAACLIDVSFGKPLSSDELRNPLFPQVVQDFVVDVIQEFLQVVDDMEIFSVQKITPEEAFSVFYDMVFRANSAAGNPNAKFHALSKAQSVEENYNVADGKYLLLASTYTMGELLLQAEILNEVSEKGLSRSFAKEVIDSVSSVSEPSVSNYIRAGYHGYINFLKTVGLLTKTTAFHDPAVFVQVMNALRL